MFSAFAEVDTKICFDSGFGWGRATVQSCKKGLSKNLKLRVVGFLTDGNIL